ncbi:hypothetical protein SHDE107825_04345 [Shewanella denitrificans]
MFAIAIVINHSGIAFFTYAGTADHLGAITNSTGLNTSRSGVTRKVILLKPFRDVNQRFGRGHLPICSVIVPFAILGEQHIGIAIAVKI